MTNPAIQELAGAGARFVLWKDINGRKVPLTTRAKAASSTDPATWCIYEDALAAAKRHKANGVAFVFNGDGLGGADLDRCRNPGTGEITPWAWQLIRELNSYTEISPSGTGVKIYFRVDPLPVLHANKRVIAKSNDGGKDQAVEAYTNARYFALTGQHLEGTPDEICDATEAFERLARWLAEGREQTSGKANGKAAPDLEQLPPELRKVVEGNAKLRAAWLTGTKLGRGGDTSASGMECSIALYLARLGYDDEMIELALRHYPYGQIGGGKLNGRNAERRIERLLREAAAVRQIEATWRQELILSKSGQARDCAHNVVLALTEAPELVGRVRLDEFKQAIICRNLPWSPGEAWRPWRDTDTTALAVWCQREDIMVRSATCAEAVELVASDNRFHPVREWLSGLVWDGTPRLDTWLEKYLGARPSGASKEEIDKHRRYLAEVGRRWLISAPARIFRPGCKADCALILEGGQGLLKSTALATLSPQPSWFADEVASIGTKDAAQDLPGKWLIEISELSAMRRGEVEAVKAWMSRAVDHYRPSYGRSSQDFPRQCVFAGTTNADTYLADETGARRFWPVRVGKIDIEALRRDRDQLWAEAVAAFRAGERWWLDKEVEQIAGEVQAERRQPDPWDETVLDWLDRQPGDITVSEVLFRCLNIPSEKQDQGKLNRVASILRHAGWVRKRKRVAGSLVWFYQRSQCSQSEPSETGNEKANDHMDVPSVPSVPSTAPTQETDHHLKQTVGGGGLKRETFAKRGGTLGTLGTPPPWDDDRAWLDLVRRERNVAAKRSMIVQWACAAGGSYDGETIVLPDDLPRTLPAQELRRMVRDYGTVRNGEGSHHAHR